MHIRNQRHAQRGGAFHAVPHEFHDALLLVNRAFDDQFVVYLQDELGLKTFALQLLIDGIHGNLDDIRRSALNRRIHRGTLAELAAIVIGRGKLVGEPIAKMLLDANCTVTVAHSKTKDLNWELQNAEIIISAVGRPNTVDLGWCWNAEIVIDVGVNHDENGKLCGDCYNFDPDFGGNMKVTSVPGGIGLMTRSMLMKHVGNTSRKSF